MNLFKPTTFSWWQLGLLKWTALSFGIVIGATWPEVFAPYAMPLLIVAVLAGLYVTIVWMKKR